MNDFLLTDRDCVILDGQCDCYRVGESLPFCRKYGTINALERHTEHEKQSKQKTDKSKTGY